MWNLTLNLRNLQIIFLCLKGFQIFEMKHFLLMTYKEDSCWVNTKTAFMQCVILKADNNALVNCQIWCDPCILEADTYINSHLDFCGVIYKLKSRIWWDCLEILAQTSGSDMAPGAVAVRDVSANGSVRCTHTKCSTSHKVVCHLYFANMLLEPSPPP